MSLKNALRVLFISARSSSQLVIGASAVLRLVSVFLVIVLVVFSSNLLSDDLLACISLSDVFSSILSAVPDTLCVSCVTASSVMLFVSVTSSYTSVALTIPTSRISSVTNSNMYLIFFILTHLNNFIVFFMYLFNSIL